MTDAELWALHADEGQGGMQCIYRLRTSHTHVDADGGDSQTVLLLSPDTSTQIERPVRT